MRRVETLTERQFKLIIWQSILDSRTNSGFKKTNSHTEFELQQLIEQGTLSAEAIDSLDYINWFRILADHLGSVRLFKEMEEMLDDRKASGEELFQWIEEVLSSLPHSSYRQ